MQDVCAFLLSKKDLTSKFWSSPFVQEVRKLEYEVLARATGVSLRTHLQTQCLLFADALCYLLGEQWSTRGVAAEQLTSVAYVLIDGGEHAFMLLDNTVLQSWWQKSAPVSTEISPTTAENIRQGLPFHYSEVVGSFGEKGEYAEYDVYFPQILYSLEEVKARYTAF